MRRARHYGSILARPISTADTTAAQQLTSWLPKMTDRSRETSLMETMIEVLYLISGEREKLGAPTGMHQ